MQHHMFSRNTIKFTGGICENIKISYIIRLLFIVTADQMSLLLETCVGLAVRIFPTATRTFTKDTALSENDRGAAWHVWINAARHGRGMVAAWNVWISLKGHDDSWLKANSHIPRPVPLPCCAAKGLDSVFRIWFTQCGRVWFTHAMPRPCCARAMPRPCRFESDFSRPGYSAAWTWYSMCELASAVQRRHVDDLPAVGFFRLPRGVHRRLLLEAYQSVRIFPAITWNFTKYKALSKNSRGAAWHVWIKAARQGIGAE
jgi:hypothetical protein